MQGVGQTVEFGAVSCLTDVDIATNTSYHRIPHDTEADQEEDRLLRCRGKQYAYGGDAAHFRAVPHRRPQGGFIGAQA